MYEKYFNGGGNKKKLAKEKIYLPEKHGNFHFRSFFAYATLRQTYFWGNIKKRHLEKSIVKLAALLSRVW